MSGKDRPIDRYAVASLVLGLLGLVLFSVLYGAGALARMRREGTKGAEFAIGGLVLSAVWTAIGVLVVLPRLLHPAPERPVLPAWLTAAAAEPPPPAGPAPGPVSLSELGVYECFDTTALDSLVERADCDLPHDEEIFGKSDAGWAAGARLGDPALRDAVLAECRKSGEGEFRTKPAPPGLIITAHLPDAAAWDAGTRSAACTFKLESGKLTRSLVWD